MSNNKNLYPRLTSLANSLPSSVPFVAPEMTERLSGIPFIARLGANESSFGPSPKVKKIIAESTSDVFKYGDPDAFDLKKELDGLVKLPGVTNAKSKHHCWGRHRWFNGDIMQIDA